MPAGHRPSFPSLLLGTVGVQTALALNLLQWNPHWECFEWNKHHCAEEFLKRLSHELVHSDIDFANVVELTSENRQIPSRWKFVDHHCGLDRTSLIYNSDRWDLPVEEAAGSKGCMAHKDRPFIVQQFTETTSWGGGRKVIVVAAHYPHTRDRGPLVKALKSVMMASQEDSVILMADTNENSGVSNARILTEIEVPIGSMQGSKLMPTCCLNSGFRSDMTYDRIITNFGSSMHSSIPLDEVPAWAQGEFHKPVKAVLVDTRSTKTSSTTSTLSTTATTHTTTTPQTTSTTTLPMTSTLTHTVTTITATTTTTTTTTIYAPAFMIAPSVVFCFVLVSSFSVASFVLCGAVFCRGKLPPAPAEVRPLRESMETQAEDTKCNSVALDVDTAVWQEEDPSGLEEVDDYEEGPPPLPCQAPMADFDMRKVRLIEPTGNGVRREMEPGPAKPRTRFSVWNRLPMRSRGNSGSSSSNNNSPGRLARHG